jgi:hypothetical protein
MACTYRPPAPATGPGACDECRQQVSARVESFARCGGAVAVCKPCLEQVLIYCPRCAGDFVPRHLGGRMLWP